MRWRDLVGELLLLATRLWSLGKLLELARGTTRGSTNILTMLRAMLITMIHCLQERMPNMSEYKT
jgi:hypothetical protein